MNESTQLARVIVRQIIESGITDVVISPGSRNAPLSFAFFAAQEKGYLKIHMRIDERTAAFFALGLAKASNRAVPIVCTSGTAVANYHPAVLEAHHSNISLLILTADRPARMRRTGASQTTEQARIFGKAVRYFADISGPVYPMELPLYALGNGPVHLNLQFDEPLSSDADTSWLDEIVISPRSVKSRKGAGTLRISHKRGILVVGHDRAGFSVETVKKFAAELGWPMLAEDPLSFEEAVAHPTLFLSSTTISKDLTPKTVIVIGRTTLSRAINSLIASADKTIVIDPRISTSDSDRRADQRFLELPNLEAQSLDLEWNEKWQKIAQRTAKLVAGIEQWNEQMIAKEFGSAIKSGTSVFVASSRPIRDLETFATPRSGINTYANRGLAGIDGNISTASGIALARGSAIAILGDLAFLHDITGLVHNEEINLKIFVINNNGGGIFSTLSHRGTEGFETLFGTPHGLDLEKIALSFGVQSRTINNINDLRHEILAPIKGISVIVLDVPGREDNADSLKKIISQVDSI
ncbi:MAG: 2-succinyl-5-enolpyruvyl-6-hydroxy-3-cyclohexene-1-carboxylic-acid synthase [Actinobacteria bacterium]|nr:2-succinyl-5-enolpyruvyl-6-hydroxy-3-cyclohexene-1-carboxylic-acid synthase [Actinomycetota bacterium]